MAGEAPRYAPYLSPTTAPSSLPASSASPPSLIPLSQPLVFGDSPPQPSFGFLPVPQQQPPPPPPAAIDAAMLLVLAAQRVSLNPLPSPGAAAAPPFSAAAIAPPHHFQPVAAEPMPHHPPLPPDPLPPHLHYVHASLTGEVPAYAFLPQNLRSQNPLLPLPQQPPVVAPLPFQRPASAGAASTAGSGRQLTASAPAPAVSPALLRDREREWEAGRERHREREGEAAEGGGEAAERGERGERGERLPRITLATAEQRQLHLDQLALRVLGGRQEMLQPVAQLLQVRRGSVPLHKQGRTTVGLCEECRRVKELHSGQRICAACIKHNNGNLKYFRDRYTVHPKDDVELYVAATLSRMLSNVRHQCNCLGGPSPDCPCVFDDNALTCIPCRFIRGVKLALLFDHWPPY